VPTIQPSQHAVQVPQLREGAFGKGAAAAGCNAITRPQHLLYFLPLPQGQGSFRGTLTGP
jgi:hypothetical protein